MVIMVFSRCHWIIRARAYSYFAHDRSSGRVARVCIIFRSGQWVSRARRRLMIFLFQYHSMILCRDGIYINPMHAPADCFISFFEYTQRIEWKENIIPRREAFICRFFFYSRFRPRARGNKSREKKCVCRGAGLEKRAAAPPRMMGFLFEEFHPLFITAAVYISKVCPLCIYFGESNREINT